MISNKKQFTIIFFDEGFNNENSYETDYKIVAILDTTTINFNQYNHCQLKTYGLDINKYSNIDLVLQSFQNKNKITIGNHNRYDSCQNLQPQIINYLENNKSCLDGLWITV